MAQGGRLSAARRACILGVGVGPQCVRVQRKEVKESSGEAAWFSVLELIQNEQGTHTV